MAPGRPTAAQKNNRASPEVIADDDTVPPPPPPRELPALNRLDWTAQAVEEVVAKRLAYPTECASAEFFRSLGNALGIPDAYKGDDVERVVKKGSWPKWQGTFRKQAEKVFEINERIVKGTL